MLYIHCCYPVLGYTIGSLECTELCTDITELLKPEFIQDRAIRLEMRDMYAHALGAGNYTPYRVGAAPGLYQLVLSWQINSFS